MNVRIVRQLPDQPLELPVVHCQVGLVYDLPLVIATYLIAEGFAVEVRRGLKRRKTERIDLRKFREFINEHREGKKIRPA